MAMTFMQSSIQGAGFYPSTVASGVVTTNAVSAFPATGSFTTSGQALVGADGAANTDTLSVRFIADPTNTSAFQGCSAAPVANTLYTDVFSIDTVNQNLICTENGTQYTLIVGVSGVNILYGVDAPSGSSGSVTQYLTATNVTASLGYWNYVKTVQLTLLFTNPLAGQPGQPATISLSQTIPYMASL